MQRRVETEHAALIPQAFGDGRVTRSVSHRQGPGSPLRGRAQTAEAPLIRSDQNHALARPFDANGGSTPRPDRTADLGIMSGIPDRDEEPE